MRKRCRRQADAARVWWWWRCRRRLRSRRRQTLAVGGDANWVPLAEQSVIEVPIIAAGCGCRLRLCTRCTLRGSSCHSTGPGAVALGAPVPPDHIVAPAARTGAQVLSCSKARLARCAVVPHAAPLPPLATHLLPVQLRPRRRASGSHATPLAAGLTQVPQPQSQVAQGALTLVAVGGRRRRRPGYRRSVDTPRPPGAK